MSKHHVAQVTLQGFKLAAVIVGDVGGWNAGDLGHNLFHLGLGDDFFAFARRKNALRCTGFVNHVNGLVWQMPVIDVLGAQLSRRLQSRHGVLDVVMLFKARFETLEDFDRFVHCGLDHINLLETPAQRGIFLKNTPVLGERGGTNAFERARTQRGLQQVGGIQCAAGRRACTNQGVYFINEQHGVGLVLERLQDPFKALLKVATVFGAGQQRTHVE